MLDVAKNPLTVEVLSEGLTSIQKTYNGETFAFSDLSLEGKNLDSLGDNLTDFEHLRVINLNKNKFSNIDKLRNLKFLQSLEACDNALTDNYFMSESKQQLKFLTSVNLSGNKLTKLRQLLCTKLRNLNVDGNIISECELVSHS
jgi:Leucine-rich repeat (LRR) protein